MDHSTKETALIIYAWSEYPAYFTGIINYYNQYHWFVNGVHHREDGPAIEQPDGTKYWIVNGIRHRLNGPAFIFFTNSRILNGWYRDGVKLDFINFLETASKEDAEHILWNLEQYI